jgi:broad-specificity NMP kinase
LRKLVVAITGTPGTGKSTFAKRLAKELDDCEVIEINDVVERNVLYSGKDQFGSKIVDITKLNRALKAEIKKSDAAVVLVVGHLVPDLDLRQDVTIVLRAKLKTLIGRFEKRDYPEGKIRENLVVEATDYCGIVSRERCASTYEAETTADKDRVMAYVLDISKHVGAREPVKKAIEKMDELLELIEAGNRFGL